MGWGPTVGAQEATASWAARPGLSRALRSVVFATPIVASFLATRLLGGVYWHPTGAAGFAVWVAQVLVVGSAVVVLTGRAARRLLPLAALFNLSLAFPDEAPSRFRVALRSGTIRNLEAQLADVRAHGFGATDAEAAQRVIELVTALGRHERLTRGHTERVRAYTDLIAAEMGLTATDRDKLRWASYLHDIGKLAVPADILNKAGKPTDEEWAILQSHPAVGGEIVEPLASWLGPWRLAASQHHERWDGTGYPNRLAGTDISLAGRIVAVADAYDVITSARSYKKPMTAVAARAELVRCSGTQFDPTIVRTFLAVSIGKRGQRTGAVGWLAELARMIATGAAQTTSAAGSVVAATAIASATAVGAMASVPVASPTPSEGAAAKVASEIVDHNWAATPTDGVVRANRASSPSASAANAAVPGAPSGSTGARARATTGSGATGTGTGATRPANATVTTTTTTASASASTPTEVTTTTTTAAGTAPAPGGGTSTTSTSTTAPSTTTTSIGSHARVAADDAATAASGATITVDVLANDTDPDGDLDPTTLTITTPPAKGTAIVSNGTIVYTASTSGNTVNIRYQICDRGGRCATAKLQVKPA